MPTPTIISCPISASRPTLSLGSTGSSVATMQTKINARLTILGAPVAALVADGNFGPITQKAAKYIQCVAFLQIDGIVGTKTWNYLCSAESSLPVIALGNPNAVVIQQVQQLLQFDGYYSGAIDGIFGVGTRTAVMNYQGDIPLTQDGIIGPNTWVSLVRRKVTGGSCNIYV
jgi:peptidoglycan hydrolase-like protein with peptidoglycan-binding domain